MKKYFLLLAVFAAMFFITSFTVYHSTGMLFATGSPYDGDDCSACHAGGTTVPNFSITATPSFGSGNVYSPNTTYTINVQCAGNYPAYGLGLEILNTTTAGAGDAGTFDSAIANCKIVSINKKPTNITHVAPTGTNDSALFRFIWTAPAAGSAYLYCAVNGVDLDASQNGDRSAATSMVLAAGTSGVSFSEEKAGIEIFPNPSSDGKFNINCSVSACAMQVYALSGEKVFEKRNCEKTENISIRGRQPSIYLLKISFGANTVVRKLVVE